MSEISPILVLQKNKHAKLWYDIAKVVIKSEKLTPFGGIFSIMELFDSSLSSVIDSTLGLRSTLYGYQYSEIIRSLMSVYFCGGSCIEDVTTHLMPHLSLHPTLCTCSADTILRAINPNRSLELMRSMGNQGHPWLPIYLWRLLLLSVILLDTRHSCLCSFWCILVWPANYTLHFSWTDDFGC